MPIAAHLHLAPLREGVHGGDTDAVQAAGDLVAVVVELAAGVSMVMTTSGADCRLVHVDRNAAAVVFDRDRAVGVNRDVD